MRYIGIGMAVAISLFLLGATTASASEWNMSLNATSELEFVTFGISPSPVTDDYDVGIDLPACLPGAAGSSWTQMALLRANGAPFQTWINSNNTTWVLRVEINRMSPTTISWTPANLPDNLDITINDTNMRYASSIELSGNSTGSVTHNLTVTTDTTAPVITSVANGTPGASSVLITWDTDENSTSLVEYGTVSDSYTHNTSNATLVTSHSITLTGLTKNTTYYFMVNSTDRSGNSNNSSESSFTTGTNPAPAITGWGNDKTSDNSTSITVNESESVRFNATANQTIATWSWFKDGADPSNNFDNYTTSWSVNGTNTVTVNATNENDTSNTVTWTITVNDITPPASIADLQNTTYEATYINWTWTDPVDADFAKVMVYLDGAFKTNVTKGVLYYNATWLTDGTEYVIGTRTVDTSGNINATWVNDSVTTLDTDPAVITGHNNVTNDDSLSITVNESEAIRFNATADQTISIWRWLNNETDQNRDFDNYTTSWSVNGTNTVTANAMNENGTSNTVTWTITVNDITPPAQVQGLTVDTVTISTVNLSWDANSESDLAGYRVYKNGSLIGTTTTANRYYNVTGLSDSTTYEFNVSAYDDNGLGGVNASETVTTYSLPNITSWAPTSPVTDSEGATRAFNITVDQTANVTWKIGSTVVETDADTKTATYTNTSAQPGTWTVSAVATNANGTDTQEWTWTVIANGSISGTVTAGSSTGAAVCGATVYAINASTGTTIATAETGGDGKYLIESIVPDTYTLNVTATGYAWNNATTAVVSAGTANTSCDVVLTAQKVTLALRSGETASKIAVAGNETIFNLTATNYGTNATIAVTNSTKPGVNVTVNGATSTGAAISIGLLNDSESKNFNVTVVHANIGIYQVTITVANTTYGKSASIDLVACMKNATGVTKIGSCNTTGGNVTGNDTILENSNVTSNASVDNSTLSNTNVTQNATVEDSSVLDSSVTGSSSSVVNDAVVNCSTVDNSTVDNTTATDSQLYEGTTVTGSTITGVTANDTTVTGSTVVNVTANGSTITGTTIDTGYAVTLVGATVVDSGGSAQITGGEIVTRGVNFSNVYTAALITDLIIDQIDNTDFAANTSQSIGDIGTVGCNLTVNLTSAGTVNISETAINPDGEGSDVSNSAVIGNFLCIQCNNTSLVQNVTIRMYYTTATSYSGGVYIYHYNTATSTWDRLTTIASGTSGGMNWIEAEPNHLSTFATMGITTPTTPRHIGGGGGGGLMPPTPTPTVTATATPTASPGATTPPGEKMTSAPAKSQAAGTTPAAEEPAPAKPEKKGLLPGFEGVFAIAGLLAIGYVMMRRKR